MYARVKLVHCQWLELSFFCARQVGNYATFVSWRQSHNIFLKLEWATCLVPKCHQSVSYQTNSNLHLSYICISSIDIDINVFFSKVAREDVWVKKSNCTTGIRTRGPSLLISGALPTELWCSCQSRQNRTTLSLEHQTHFSCETTQAGGTQPSTVTHTFHIESTMCGAPMRYILLIGCSLDLAKFMPHTWFWWQTKPFWCNISLLKISWPYSIPLQGYAPVKTVMLVPFAIYSHALHGCDFSGSMHPLATT